MLSGTIRQVKKIGVVAVGLIAVYEPQPGEAFVDCLCLLRLQTQELPARVVQDEAKRTRKLERLAAPKVHLSRS